MSITLMIYDLDSYFFSFCPLCDPAPSPFLFNATADSLSQRCHICSQLCPYLENNTQRIELNVQIITQFANGGKGNLFNCLILLPVQDIG